MNKYDVLIVGTGLYGAVFAERALCAGKKVLMVEKRDHVGGNAYTENSDGIEIHRYGAHIFHTNDAAVWEYVNRFSAFSGYVHSPKANYKGTLYTLPFNMDTFNEMWGVDDPDDARKIIEAQRSGAAVKEPCNLEEQALALVGRDIYEKLIKGYTEKQWGRKCTELPPSIIKRIPVRFTHDSNYFNAAFQGIPKGGYTSMINRMTKGADVILNTDYLSDRKKLESMADLVVYTGPVDAYYGFRYGVLEYRTVRFETERLEKVDFQGRSVVNYTDTSTPYTRIIEHKWFEPEKKIPFTIISREYSCEWKPGAEPYYPVNDKKNSLLYAKYRKLADSEEKTVFGGRLGEYAYYDMDTVIASALKKSSEILNV